MWPDRAPVPQAGQLSGVSIRARSSWGGFFLESIFQDPCPTLNGTRRVTMPQVLTRRSEPIHPSSQARSPAPTNPKTGSGSDHPGGRSPQSQLSCSGYSCTLHNCTHRLVSQSLWLQRQGTTSVSVSAGLILLALVSCSAARRRNDSAAATDGPFRSPTNQPPPSIHLVSAATRHRLSSHSPALPLTPPHTLLFSGASSCASVLPYVYIYLTRC